jgi:hypothetical protein
MNDERSQGNEKQKAGNKQETESGEQRSGLHGTAGLLLLKHRPPRTRFAADISSSKLC